MAPGITQCGLDILLGVRADPEATITHGEVDPGQSVIELVATELLTRLLGGVVVSEQIGDGVGDEFRFGFRGDELISHRDMMVGPHGERQIPRHLSTVWSRRLSRSPVQAYAARPWG